MNPLYANDKAGEYPSSWYAATADFLPSQPRLDGETRADICVIGAGYTGLSTALHLAQAGFDVALIEAQRVGFGASGRNGGQVGSGHNMGQQRIEKRMGPEAAHALWDIAQDAKALTRTLADQYAPGEFRAGIIHADWHARDVAHTHAEARYLAQNYGYDRIEPLDRDGLQDIVCAPAYQGGIIDWGAGHLNPLRYALGLGRAALAAGVRIYERSPARHIKNGTPATVRTDRGHVIADHVVLAANGYLAGLAPKIESRVLPINNFIIATAPLTDPGEVLAQDLAVYDSKFVVNYFRLSHDNRLLFGGGESYGLRFPRDIKAKVRKPMIAVFPQLANVQIDYAWGGTLAITPTRMPCFAALAPNVLNASGYSGHGVAMATMAGKIIAEMIRGDSARFDLMARVPTPPFPGGRVLAQPVLALAMTWFALRDRLGV